MSLSRIVFFVGLLNGVIVAMALVTPLTVNGHEYGWSQALSLMILHGVVSAVLVYAALERQRGTDLGYKAFPASIMSYVLWLCMFLRWAAQ